MNNRASSNSLGTYPMSSLHECIQLFSRAILNFRDFQLMNFGKIHFLKTFKRRIFWFSELSTESSGGFSMSMFTRFSRHWLSWFAILVSQSWRVFSLADFVPGIPTPDANPDSWPSHWGSLAGSRRASCGPQGTPGSYWRRKCWRYRWWWAGRSRRGPSSGTPCSPWSCGAASARPYWSKLN